jgi:Glycosyltransferase family 87
MSLAPTVSIQKFLNYRNLLIFLALLYFVKVLTLGAGDFAVYYGAANDIRQGNPIYFVEYPVGDNHETCSYSYPPFFAMILIPLSILPLPLADFLWLLLSLVLLLRIFSLVEDFLDINTFFATKTYRFWVFLMLLFTARFILYNFDMSQTTLVLLWGCLESLNLTMKNRPVLSGFLLAAVISIKLLPLVMLPYFFYRRFFKTGFSTLVFLILLNMGPSVFYGFEGYFSVLNQWKTVINPIKTEFILEENRVMESAHSLSALVPSLLTDNITRFGIKRNITVLPYEKVVFWLTISQLFFITLTLFFLKTRPFVGILDKKCLFYEVSYLMLIVPLIFPHQQKYAFVMLLPAVAFIWFEVLKQKKEGIFLKNIIALMVVVWLLTTASTDGFIGRALYEYGQYFKLITWGAILLIIPLSILGNRLQATGNMLR